MEEKDLNTPQTEEIKNETPSQTEETTCAPENTEEIQEAETAELTEEDKLAQAEAEIVELKDKLLRQAADFANFRKHSIAKQTDLILNGGKKVLESLLPILDDMERAETNMNENSDVEALKEGLLLIFQKLLRTLEQQGLKKMDTEAAVFDTDFHEAVALFPTEEEDKKNHIIDCVQTGYMLNDKVLRHAKVVVGQ
ncbi:nucleotide exchange factor GrpE [Alloprevotella sp. OH1205_COT-284]|uniref:nucleotide exchange factor GrpE n=1 Tax=Alloprevotella sp. OH1205_COT-284 TaxID=2491043 RepID=UPI000F5F1D76|nr:nucleotide exchange factor GrpE [Alloprevotella sp. OH1205_COT-284]RRD78257.1 nucleotide exchange factor GrpE [Alloprevotella sp. OH1205_COT-284]